MEILQAVHGHGINSIFMQSTIGVYRHLIDPYGQCHVLVHDLHDIGRPTLIQRSFAPVRGFLHIPQPPRHCTVTLRAYLAPATRGCPY